MYVFGTLDLGKSLEIPELSISCLHAVKTTMFSSFPNPSLRLACCQASKLFPNAYSLSFQRSQISAASTDHPGAVSPAVKKSAS